MKYFLVVVTVSIVLTFLMQNTVQGFKFSLPGQWGNNAKRFSFSLPGQWGNGQGKRASVGRSRRRQCESGDLEELQAVYNFLQEETQRVKDCMEYVASGVAANNKAKQ